MFEFCRKRLLRYQMNLKLKQKQFELEAEAK
jgi:hypothetical protein